MFFNTKIFKQLLKKSYKGTGLRIAHTEAPEGYYLSSGYWYMWMHKKFIPKEILAAMIEVCGELPEIGQRHKVDKESTQIEMDAVFVEDLSKEFSRASKKYRVTNTYMQQRGVLCSILQAEGTNEVRMLASCYPALIDFNAVNTEKGEELPKGPVATSTRMMWGNEDCYFAVLTRDADCTAEEEFLNALKGVYVV